MNEPWTSLGIPQAHGAVVLVERPTILVVRYAAQPDDVLDAIRAALNNGGWGIREERHHGRVMDCSLGSRRLRVVATDQNGPVQFLLSSLRPNGLLAAARAGAAAGAPGVASLPSVPLTLPWTTMGLPVRRGSVLYSDATSVTIAYEGEQQGNDDFQTIVGQYVSAITGSGWSELNKFTDGDMVSATYRKESESLTLGAQEALGMVSVTLIVY